MFDWLLEPLQFEFMQNALLTAFIVSIICALLSCSSAYPFPSAQDAS